MQPGSAACVSASKSVSSSSPVLVRLQRTLTHDFSTNRCHPVYICHMSHMCNDVCLMYVNVRTCAWVVLCHSLPRHPYCEIGTSVFPVPDQAERGSLQHAVLEMSGLQSKPHHDISAFPTIYACIVNMYIHTYIDVYWHIVCICCVCMCMYVYVCVCMSVYIVNYMYIYNRDSIYMH